MSLDGFYRTLVLSGPPSSTIISVSRWQDVDTVHAASVKLDSPTNQIDAPLCVLECDYKTVSGGVNLSVSRLLPLWVPTMVCKLHPKALPKLTFGPFAPPPFDGGSGESF